MVVIGSAGLLIRVPPQIVGLSNVGDANDIADRGSHQRLLLSSRRMWQSCSRPGAGQAELAAQPGRPPRQPAGGRGRWPASTAAPPLRAAGRPGRGRARQPGRPEPPDQHRPQRHGGRGQRAGRAGPRAALPRPRRPAPQRRLPHRGRAPPPGQARTAARPGPGRAAGPALPRGAPDPRRPAHPGRRPPRRGPDPPMGLTLRELNRATLARQLLLRRERLAVADAVRRVVAIQAQEAPSPYIALWNRLAPFDPAGLDAAFAERGGAQGDAHADHAARGGRARTTRCSTMRWSRRCGRRACWTAASPPPACPPPTSTPWPRDVLAFASRPRTQRGGGGDAGRPPRRHPRARGLVGPPQLRPPGPRPHRWAVVVRPAARVHGRARRRRPGTRTGPSGR